MIHYERITMMRSGNPALMDSVVFTRELSVGSKDAMRIRGTMNKILVLLAIIVFSAFGVWAYGAWINPAALVIFVLLGAIGGLVVGVVTIFKKQWARITSPIYALLEGFLLGAISAIFERSYPGIVIQAIALTFGVLFCILLAYKLGLIKVTINVKLGVIVATWAIALIYIVTLVGVLFGFHIPFIHESGPIGIAFSLFVVAIASLNLALDFNYIEEVAEVRAPRYMEWYCAFGLMVTLVWLYIEILRLLAKIIRRR